jgi:amino acid permease
VAILSGFAPWIVYWVLVGNVPFKVAVLAALGIAALSFAISRVRGTAGRTLELGAIGTFVVLTLLTFTLSEDFMERWVQSLSSAGIFLVALTGVLIGRPFVREFAEVDQPPNVVKSELFGRITTSVTWIWVGAFAGMTVSSAIPPLVQGNATLLDTRTPLSFIGYWVVPFLLLGLAVVASRVLTDRMVAEANSPNTVRKTTFLAFKELGIDELLYLAHQKAEREVGPGKEAFAVQVGGKGVPLTGDESRESWPATYKVRDAR